MSTELVPVQAGIQTQQQAPALNREQVELLKRTICKGATDDELALFRMVCARTGLDPFSRQIHAVKRRVKNDATGNWEDSMTFQTGIDGFRLISQRTGLYEGQTEPQWCGEDGEWKNIWTSQDPPYAARVGVYRKGFREPIYGVALYREFVQEKHDGTPIRMWAKMACTMLAKCAETQAHRKAFPQETGDVYVQEEMLQAVPVDDKPVIGAGSVPPRFATKKERIEAFEAMVDRLGKEQFNKIMLDNGFEDGKSLVSSPKADLVYGLMENAAKAAEASHA